VPTLMAPDSLMPNSPSSPRDRAKARAGERNRCRRRSTRGETEVKIAFGTDSGVSKHGLNATNSA